MDFFLSKYCIVSYCNLVPKIASEKPELKKLVKSQSVKIFPVSKSWNKKLTNIKEK